MKFLFTIPKLKCQYKEYFGVECPGCGFQRSIELLLNGEIVASVKMYPPLLPLIITFVFLFITIKTTNKLIRRIFYTTLFITLSIIFINYILKFF